MSEQEKVLSIRDDYSITKLFLTKQVKIWVEKENFEIFLPPIKDYFLDSHWNAAYHLFTMDLTDWKKMITLDSQETYDFLKHLLFELSRYIQYKEIGDVIQQGLQKLGGEQLEINFNTKEILFNSITITPEIWNYVVYLLKLSCGRKVTQPLNFETAEARAFFEKQQELEKKIQATRAKAQENDEDSLMKAFMMITYYFPSLTFDYLFNQTMAQIRWLQQLAAGATSYEFNAQAYAAGNVKKGKKLDFFIK